MREANGDEQRDERDALPGERFGDPIGIPKVSNHRYRIERGKRDRQEDREYAGKRRKPSLTSRHQRKGEEKEPHERHGTRDCAPALHGGSLFRFVEHYCLSRVFRASTRARTTKIMSHTAMFTSPYHSGSS